MTRREEYKLAMYNRLEEWLASNEPTLSEVVQFKTLHTQFKNNKADLKRHATLQVKSIKAVTLDKYHKSTRMIDKCVVVAGVIFSYATSISDRTLQANIHYTHSDFVRARITKQTMMASNVLDAARKHAEALIPYGITPAIILQLEKYIADYYKVCVAPRSAIVTRKCSTATIKKIIKETDLLLTHQFDKLIPLFKESHPSIYREYLEVRKVGRPTARKTTIAGQVIHEHSQQPAAEATVQIVGKLCHKHSIPVVYTLQTDKQGKYNVPDLSLGIYNISILQPGCKAIQIKGIKPIPNETTLLASTLQFNHSNLSLAS